MKQSLQLRVSQQLTLTPQLQQSIRLLQLSTQELNQELERFLAENPLLEREEPAESPRLFESRQAEVPTGPAQEAPAPAATPESDEIRVPEGADGAAQDWSTTTYGNGPRDPDDDYDGPQIAAEHPSLRAHLLHQVGLLNLDRRDRALVELLIEALDDDGYLDQPLDEILAMLPEELGVEIEELAVALRHLQSLEPAGVGARSPQESLELQLLALDPDTRGRALALQVAREHLDLLAARDFTKLKRFLQCDDAQLRLAQKLIQSLNPRPGAEYTQIETRYIIPDVIVRKVKNVWVASLNPDAMPKLRINRMYADLLQGHRNGSAAGMSQQLQEARWLIKNVRQRFDTIQRVSQVIVDRQRHFFEHGEVAMRPLVLREIAEALGLHESTVSRVTTQKFMATPRGIFELKYFFGSHVATDTGGACSATAIRALIRQLVASEDGKRPLSDSKISEILGQQGIMVARRTIAKYRESLQIPPVNLRKSL